MDFNYHQNNIQLGYNKSDKRTRKILKYLVKNLNEVQKIVSKHFASVITTDNCH